MSLTPSEAWAFSFGFLFCLALIIVWAQMNNRMTLFKQLMEGL